MAVGNSCVPLTFERIFRNPSGFALLSHLPLQGRQEVCGVDRGSFLTGTLMRYQLSANLLILNSDL